MRGGPCVSKGKRGLCRDKSECKKLGRRGAPGMLERSKEATVAVQKRASGIKTGGALRAIAQV